MAINYGSSKNNSLLNSIIEDSNQNKNTLVTIDIDINSIDKNPDNEKIFNMKDIEFLAEGIESEGFHGVIEVYKKADGRYEISSGHRRYEAARRNKMKRIPCLVLEDTDKRTKAERLLSSNIRNRKLTPLDYARAIQYYKENVLASKVRGDGKTRDKVAKFFNISPTQVQRYEALLKLIEPLQRLADDDNYSYAVFSPASSLTEEEQYKLYDMIVDFQKENPDISISSQRISLKITELKRKNAVADNQKNDKSNNDVSEENSAFLKMPEKVDCTVPPTVYTREEYKDIMIKSVNNVETPKAYVGDNSSYDEEDVNDIKSYAVSSDTATIDAELLSATKKIKTLLKHNHKFMNKAVIVDCFRELKEAVGELEILISESIKESK